MKKREVNINDSKAELNRVLKIKIDDPALKLRAPLVQHLKKAGILYVGQLTEKTKDELAEIERLGRVSMKEIKEALAGLGLSLGIRLENWTPPTS